MPPADLILTAAEHSSLGEDPSNAIELQLRTAKSIDDNTKNLLTEMVRLAFEQAKDKGET